MTERPRRSTSTTSRVVSALQELINAIDRRRPHPDRPGETRIASDAASLRGQAVTRIDSLAPVGLKDRRFNQGLAEAVMTDDGGPASETTATEKLR